MRTLQSIVLALTILLAGCSTPQKSQNVGPATLFSQWELMELNGEPVMTEAPIHISFSDNNSISGFVGCNRMSGAFETKGDELIRFDNLIVTRMACPDLDLEQKFLSALNEADHILLEDNNLYLGTNENRRLVVLMPMGTHDLINKRWVLEELNGTKPTHEDPHGMDAFFILKNNEKIIGYTGCNHFNGSYDLLKKNKIAFGKHMAVTMKACLDEYISEFEYLKVFEQADRFELEGEMLTLKAKKKVLARFRAEPLS